MTTPIDRAEINRTNSKRSTGPRSSEGKLRSKFNAVKHGMSAKVPVLPGEDEGAFRRRVEEWTDHLAPRNPVEQFLVEQAVTASWKLERADRVETARLSSLMRTAAAERAGQDQEEVIALGRRLISREGDPSGAGGRDDLPKDPEAIVDRLESTATGCRWLLARWLELLDILDKGQTWDRTDMGGAVRLVGRRRLEVPRRTRERLESELEAAFEEDRSETYVRDLAMKLDHGIADDPSRNRLAMVEVVRREAKRLTTMAKEHDERTASVVAEQSDRLSFEDGNEGERLRRYHFGCGRELHRSLDALAKLRKTIGDATWRIPEVPRLPTRAPSRPASSDPASSPVGPSGTDPIAADGDLTERSQPAGEYAVLRRVEGEPTERSQPAGGTDTDRRPDGETTERSQEPTSPATEGAGNACFHGAGTARLRGAVRSIEHGCLRRRRAP